MKVVKQSGHYVDFDREKLRKSMIRSGADAALVDNVVQKISASIYDGISTRKIYKLAFSLLKKESSSHAARYNLKGALQMLGPAGFFFEKFIARLFESQGYQTEVNCFLQGTCVTHEIDVVAQKNEITAMIECKFHATPAAVTDVKVPMYILSRFNDIKPLPHKLMGQHQNITTCILVTNSRFTSDALAFGTCCGLTLLSWDYPKHENIRHLIDRERLYPITCLTTLTAVEKEKVLIQGIILVSDLPDQSFILEAIGLSPQRIKNVLQEIRELTKTKLTI
ncbi:restriction endonuclease [Flavobacterium sp.]|jgi:hypothetical protein|uniref:restriction endonuclease n=1 Tax=Flavobacterium sp. TaxID=239 RepID=UPI0022CAAF54|nr:ATP cone domain-containing protein [Flavobacterium sp.]MCZ8143947.1 restriction endonuclease [Flavobacterium sp.]MCZ8367325.1 restriction endonuclease [Flavobacterium sp.]